MRKSTDISRLLNRIARRYNSLVTRKQEEAGLTPEMVTSSRALGVLLRSPDSDIFQKDIEKELGLSKSVVSGLVSRMESNGYVKRGSLTTDGRYRKVSITESGAELHDCVIHQFDVVSQQMVKGLTRDEMETLYSLLSRLLSNLRKMSEDI